jgi:hypothetical protein
VDHVPCLQAWAESLGGIHYPLLSDFWPHGQMSNEYGVLRAEGFSERAIFVIDRKGVIRYIDIHDIGNQPSNAELFRVLREVDPEASARFPEQQPDQVALPHGGIVMYLHAWCSDCRNARAWLKRTTSLYRGGHHHHTGCGGAVKPGHMATRPPPTLILTVSFVVDLTKPAAEVLKDR